MMSGVNWKRLPIILAVIVGAGGYAGYLYREHNGAEKEQAWSPVGRQVEALLERPAGPAPAENSGAPTPSKTGTGPLGRLRQSAGGKETGGKPSGSLPSGPPPSAPPSAAPSEGTRASIGDAVPPASSTAAPAAVLGQASAAESRPHRPGQDEPIDINSASAARLTDLPGIGPGKAKAIVDYREKNGPFRSPADLMKVKGIGPKTYESLKKRITASP